MIAIKIIIIIKKRAIPTCSGKKKMEKKKGKKLNKMFVEFKSLKRELKENLAPFVPVPDIEM